jgi:hypothetical protein
VYFEPGENHWHGAAPPLHGPRCHSGGRRERQPRHLG